MLRIDAVEESQNWCLEEQAMPRHSAKELYFFSTLACLQSPSSFSCALAEQHERQVDQQLHADAHSAVALCCSQETCTFLQPVR